MKSLEKMHDNVGGEAGENSLVDTVEQGHEENGDEGGERLFGVAQL